MLRLMALVDCFFSVVTDRSPCQNPERGAEENHAQLPFHQFRRKPVMNSHAVRRISFITGILLWTQLIHAQVDTLWLKRHDGPAHVHDVGNKLTTDSDGNIYIVGSANSAAGGPADYVTIKLRPNGDTVWMRLYDGPVGGHDEAVGIVLDGQGNVYITGESDDSSSVSSYATVKYDSSGNQLWARRYSPPELYFSHYDAVAIGIDGASNIYVSGTHWNLVMDAMGGLNNADIVTLKYDKDGNLLWSKVHGGDGYYVWTFTGSNYFWRLYPSLEGCSAMHVDVAGNVTITGQAQPFGYYSSYMPAFNYITMSYPSTIGPTSSPAAAMEPPAGVTPAEKSGDGNVRFSQASGPIPQYNECGLHLMSPGQRLSQAATRPALSGPELTITTTNFRIHYTTSGTDSTTVQWADSVAADAEDVWSKYSALGWQMPPPDGANGGNALFDVYIRNTLPDGYFGVAVPESPYTVFYPDGSTSYLEVYRDSLPLPFPRFARLRALLAHEFHHAVQMSYTIAETPLWAFYENCSVWGERLLYKDITTLPSRFAADPVKNPLFSPERPITDTSASYEYTGALWPTFLTEFYGGTAVRSIWEQMGSHAGPHLLQDIDATLMASFGSDLREALRHYAIWRYFTGARADTAHYFSDGKLLPTSWTLRLHAAYPAAGGDGGFGPTGPGGASMIVFANGGGATLDIAFNGQNLSGGNNSLFSGTVIGYTPGGSIEFPMTLDANSDGSRSVSFPGFDSVALVVAASHWSTTEPFLTFNYNVGQTMGLWVRTYDNPFTPPLFSFDDWEQASDLAVDGAGNIIVTGTSGVPATPVDIRTIKYSPTGSQLWLAVYSTFEAMVNPKITVDDNNDIYVAASVQPGPGDRDIATIKYSAAGAEQWKRTLDGGLGGLDDPTAIAVDQYRNVYVTGSSEIVPGHSIDYVTLRYSTNGDTGWVRSYNGPGNDRDVSKAITVDVRNNVIVTGSSVGTVLPYTDVATIKYSQKDVQAVLINSPSGTVKYDTTILPSVRVKNNGGIEATFNAVLHIGTFYTQAVLVSNLQPESLRTVDFPSWHVVEGAGVYAVVCSTQLGEDYLRANDLATSSVTVETTATTTTTTDLLMQNGWNLLSVPLGVSDYAKKTLFPTATSRAFFYDGVYVTNDTLKKGRGFWLKYSSPQIVPVAGLPITAETTDVVKGWNIIGSISKAVPVASVGSIPGGIFTTNFYQYSLSYSLTDSVRPGSGYWVKANQSGKLIFSASSAASPSTRIRIVPTDEMPPPAPDETNIGHRTSNIPHEFALEQNYPNPFNPITTIRYQLPIASHVTLKILDLLGREVETVFDGMQDAGSKAVTWDASRYAAGVYFYRLNAGSFSETKRLVLVN